MDYRPRENERYAFELRFPGHRGRPGKVVGFGVMATPATNNAKGSPEAVVYDLGPLGEARSRQTRLRLPDGRRAAPVAPTVTSNSRTAARPDLWLEQAARIDIERALAHDGALVSVPFMRVFRTLTGAIKAIPYKGPITNWASVDDLAIAIASKAV